MLAFLGLHLKPPVRELTRDAVAVEARTLARAQGLTLRALPRSAAAGPIGRAALGFTVSADASAPGAGAPGDERLRRLARGLTRIHAVVAVSVLVRPPASGGVALALAADLPTVEVDAADFEREGAASPALLPDRRYLVSGEADEEPAPRRDTIGDGEGSGGRARRPRPGPRALPPGPRSAGR